MNASRPVTLSVVVPIYNEENNLGTSIPHIIKYLRARRGSWELLAIDDGSRDSTPQMLRRLAKTHRGLRVIRLPQNLGKGAAVRAGLKAARGRFIVFTDCDLSTPTSQIPLALRTLEQNGATAGGTEIAVGSRNLPSSRLPVPQPFLRRIAGRAFNVAVRVLLGLPYTDTQCGFKAFTSRAARLIVRHSRVNGWAFDVEILLLAKQLALKVREFPIVWRDNPYTKIRLLKDSPAMFGAILSLKRRFASVIQYHPARALPLILASCVSAVLGQIFFKKGAMMIQGIPLGWEFLAAMISNYNFMFGLAFFGLGAITWVITLSKVELSFAFPMLSLNFVFTALYAWLYFGEILSTNRVVGISLVVLGVLAIAASGRIGHDHRD